MTTQFQLSPDESSAVERLLAIQTEKAKHAITLPYLTKKWSRFVTNVEDGYQLTIDDYTNSLSVRDLIQEILDICPENTSLKDWVSEWENRFIKVTKLIEEPLLPPFPNESLGWWWFRIPVNPGSEMKKWLQTINQE